MGERKEKEFAEAMGITFLKVPCLPCAVAIPTASLDLLGGMGKGGAAAFAMFKPRTILREVVTRVVAG